MQKNFPNGIFIESNAKNANMQVKWNVFSSQDIPNNGLYIICNKDNWYYEKSNGEDWIDRFIDCYNN